MGAIFIIVNLLRDRNVSGTEKVEYKNKIIKFLCKIVFPILLLGGVYVLFLCPLQDYFDPNKYTYNECGVIQAISTHNSDKIIKRNEYSIKINGQTYRLPEELISYEELRSGGEFVIYYFNKSRIIYQIDKVDFKNVY